MDDYIKNIAKKLISEEIDKRIFDIENKIFEVNQFHIICKPISTSEHM